MFFAKVSKNVLKIFSRKLVPLKMNQESIGSRNQVEVGVNHQNKILKSFFRTDQIAQIDLFNVWVMNCKINFKKIPSGNNFFP